MQKSRDIHHSLIEKAKLHNAKAQMELYGLYSQAMFRIACQILNNSMDAEDAMQEGFLKAFQKIDQFNNQSTFGAWLKRIIVNQCLDAKRKSFDFDDYEDSDDQRLEEEQTTDEGVELKVEQVKKALQLLPEGYRIVLQLYLFEGFDHQEIAEFLGVTNTTSRSQFNRAKKALRSKIMEESYA